MKWQEFVKDYLTFTRKERIGVLVITGLILLFLFLPGIIPKSKNRKSTLADSLWIAAVQKLEIKDLAPSNNSAENDSNDNVIAYQYDKTENSYGKATINNAELFYFDPNTISEAEWKKLGLRDKTIQTIGKYLSKGGHFYKPEDLEKIYGLHKNEYERLSPYVRIEQAGQKDKEGIKSEKINPGTLSANNYTSRYKIIEINTADTAAFISLPGIGSKLAVRIVNFRDKLGGFYSIDQVGETYGLPDSTFQKIKQYLKLENSLVKKININTATVEELKAHPYIKFSLANPIVAYRNEHGTFSKIEEIKNIMLITEDVYKKIQPYLTTQ